MTKRSPLLTLPLAVAVSMVAPATGLGAAGPSFTPKVSPTSGVINNDPKNELITHVNFAWSGITGMKVTLRHQPTALRVVPQHTGHAQFWHKVDGQWIEQWPSHFSLLPPGHTYRAASELLLKVRRGTAAGTRVCFTLRYVGTAPGWSQTKNVRVCHKIVKA